MVIYTNQSDIRLLKSANTWYPVAIDYCILYIIIALPHIYTYTSSLHLFREEQKSKVDYFTVYLSK